MAGYDAVLILSFGGPDGPDDVLPFLRNVTRGRDVPESRLLQVAQRYHEIGGSSPINAQCRRIVAALQAEFDDHGPGLPVYLGNRNWNPMLVDTVAAMAADGVQRALAVTTSAFSSYSGCRQYLDDIDAARVSVGTGAPRIDKVRAYYDHPGFIGPFAEATASAIIRLGDLGPDAHIMFTAHSIPTAMAEQCEYQRQLAEAAGLVTSALEASHSWSMAWQSRSGSPSEPWLEPDVNDHLRELVADGVRAVVVVPIGFVSDHMEVVFDLDNEAAATAASLDLAMTRASTPGTAPEPAFVAMLRELVMERHVPESPRRSLGALGMVPDACDPTCCRPR